VESYRELVKKAAKMEALLEKIEKTRLLKLAESRMENFDPKTAIDFKDFVNEQGFNINDIIADADNAEIE
jgi:cupin superfamily acireductone dioxygenase involved in methionine salvage